MNTPWTPKPGTDPDYAAIEAEKARQQAVYERRLRRWERWQSIRRYLLVLLLTGLGSMIGAAITILAFAHYN